MAGSVAGVSGPKARGDGPLVLPELGSLPYHTRKSVRRVVGRVVASRPVGWWSDSDWVLLHLLGEAYVDWQHWSRRVRATDPKVDGKLFAQVAKREKDLADRVRQLCEKLRLSPPEVERRAQVRRAVRRPVAASGGGGLSVVRNPWE